ncbi:SDR family oxidoreductase [Balneolaceae bacterium ANBcel3]|nr:SDR family oxidoreductase [Balneolaceae bacterium ANBcel3]
MNLSGKTAIVTGASSGLGHETTLSLLKKGCRVYGIARSKDKLNGIKDLFPDTFKPVVLDINDHQALDVWFNKTFEKSSENTPNILINNAGLGLFSGIEETDPEAWNRLIQTNLTSVFRITRLVVPQMKANPEITHIINIASVAGLIGNPNLSAYNATKFGLRGFSEALFKELRYDGIKVSCVYPGSIATPFFDTLGGTHSGMLDALDVANTILYLLETPDNVLIDEVTIRPLNPKKGQE